MLVATGKPFQRSDLSPATKGCDKKNAGTALFGQVRERERAQYLFEKGNAGYQLEMLGIDPDGTAIT